VVGGSDISGGTTLSSAHPANMSIKVIETINNVIVFIRLFISNS